MTTIGIALVFAVLVMLVVDALRGPTVIEKPVYVNRYVENPVPVYVQPAWWGAFGAPWGYKTGYEKPWKMGSGLPGMKIPPPPGGPSQPPPPAPSQPAQPPPPPPAQ